MQTLLMCEYSTQFIDIGLIDRHTDAQTHFAFGPRPMYTTVFVGLVHTPVYIGKLKIFGKQLEFVNVTVTDQRVSIKLCSGTIVFRSI